MVSDPCSATLIPGLYGSDEGMLARTKRSIRFDYGGNGATAGMFLWCPDYTNGYDVPPTQSNIFKFSTTNSSTPIVNTAANGLGTGTASSASGHVTSDPANGLLRGDIVSDMRPLAACIQMQYIGSLRDSSGEIAYVQNLPVADLLYGGAGGGPLSVDNVFAYTTHKARFGLETYENVFKPSVENSSHFRDENDSLLVLDTGVAATTVSDNVENFSPTWIGFAWRGATAEAPLTFDLIKNVEWRAEASAGLGQTSASSTGPNHVNTVQRVIEKAQRGDHSPWLRIAHSGRNVFNTAARSMLDLTSTEMGGRATNAIGNYGKQKFLEFAGRELALAAPMLLMG